MGRSFFPLFLAFCVVATTAPSCKPKKDNGASLAGFILGANNIVDLDGKQAKKAPDAALGAAVMIATALRTGNVKFCSGSLIEGKSGRSGMRILTNHHCFAIEREDGTVTPEIRPEACVATHVYFGFSAVTEYKSTRLPCKIGTLTTDPIGDLAVFELAGNPPAGVVPLSFWADDTPPTGRKAFIIHHPDVESNLRIPPGEKTPLPAASMTSDDCETGGTYAQEEWSLDPVLKFSLKHTCDLIHGSSGSALLDLETGKILGVNWGGMRLAYTRGEAIDNVATKAGYVRHFVETGDGLSYEDPSRLEPAKSSLSPKSGGTNGPSNSGILASAEREAQTSKARCGIVLGQAEIDGGQHALATGLLALLALPILLIH